VSRASLDFTDPAAVGAWLAGLQASWSDADAVALDMLRPPRARELGPALHREKYNDARGQIAQALDFASGTKAADPAD
jgi:hypothetical protein